jgi:bifunctional UDP-N-acetylglucosamine pyrophosphorylase/glucosamine-1-phosphate N-acetyltransferase
MKANRTMKIAAVVQATDPGEKMFSATSKYLHPLLGQELIKYPISNAQEATGVQPFLVLGIELDQVREKFTEIVKAEIHERGHSEQNPLLQTKNLLPDETEYLLVLKADRPLVTTTTLERLVNTHLAGISEDFSAPPLTLLSFFDRQDGSLPEVLRDGQGNVIGIGDGEKTQRGHENTQEIFADIFCISAYWLWHAITKIAPPPSGDQYLGALVRIAVSEGLPINTVNLENPDEAIIINSRVDLADAEAILRQRVNRKLMLNGVSIIDPQTTYIEADVEIEADSLILPNTHLTGSTRIGSHCAIGPNSYIQDSNIGDHCKVNNSVVEEATLEDNVDIGPFAHLRKGAHLAEGVHMGNFGEVKNSYLGKGTKMGHFSYVGDATIGPNVNIGAGVITANYDGQRKYTTEIGAGAFIGSDTMLVAPLKIGENARTGAGSVVTKDVPANSLAVGMPARIIRKKEDDDGP